MAGNTTRGNEEDPAKFPTFPPPGEIRLARLAGGSAKDLGELCKRTSQPAAAAVSTEGSEPHSGEQQQDTEHTRMYSCGSGGINRVLWI